MLRKVMKGQIIPMWTIEIFSSALNEVILGAAFVGSVFLSPAASPESKIQSFESAVKRAEEQVEGKA